MPPHRLYDNSGQPITLGSELGVGGEGSVFELSGTPGLVAKVYHKPLPIPRVEKLRWMVSLATPTLLKFAAWPTATLHDKPQGPVVGILMPKVAGYKDIHALYGPAQRKQDFPCAHWGFLIHTAMNCAAAVDAIHCAGHVVGDINQKNILVSSKALVHL